MQYEIKTVPNQKVVSIKKEKTDKQNYYAAINLQALELAARELQSGAFKLWIYFAKNQPNYTFGLSSKDAEENFGIKIKQYNNAIKELINKGYLIKDKGINYYFCEKPNSVIPKDNNDVISKGNNTIAPKDTRNNTNNTNNNTDKFIF